MADVKNKIIDNDVEKLLSHWVKRKSGFKAPGKCYYYNTRTKTSVWNLEDLIKEEKLLENQEAQIIRCLQKKNIKLKLENTKKSSISKKTALSSSSSSPSLKKRPSSPKTILNDANKAYPDFQNPVEKRPYKDKPKKPSQPQRSPPSSQVPRKKRRWSDDASLQNTEPESNPPLPSNEPSSFAERCFEPISFFGLDTTQENGDELELMEVDEVDPGILEELRDLRREEGISTQPPISEEFKFVSSDGDFHYSSSTVVIDTNIFLSHLSSIEKIIEMGHTVHVPWAVFRELDLLKDSKRSVYNGSTNTSEKLSYRARKAINFLHNALSSEDSKIYGQNGEEELEASLLFRGHNSDDKILQCCLYLKKRRTNTTTDTSSFNLLLYSNDKNLLNKALLNKIRVASSSTLLQALRKNLDTMRDNHFSNLNKRASTSPSTQTPYDLKKDIIDEARDLCLILLTDSLKLELIHLYGTFKWKSKLEPSGSSIADWSLCEAFRQVMSRWEHVYSPLLGSESDNLRKDLSVVESLLARPRPQNKVWNLIEECLKTLSMLNNCLISSRPSYYSSCGRAIQIRIESLLKRKVAIGNNSSLELSGGNIYESFNSIWNYIYAYATSYSVSMGVPLSNAVPTPKHIAFEFSQINKEEISHLNAITKESKELASKLEELLRVSSEELSTSSPHLLSLMNHMHRFIYYCSTFRPGAHPSADPLPKLVPRALLQYSINHETRQRMMNGFNQLHDLIKQLDACCSKI